MPDKNTGPNDWDRRPHGCSDDEHWKECWRKGYINEKGHCWHPETGYVHIKDGTPICHHSGEAVSVKKYSMRGSK